MPSAIEPTVAPQKTSWVFFSSVVPGSCAQTITRDSQGAHDEASFGRVGSPTWAFHEVENTMLIDEAHSRVGSAAKGSGDVKVAATFGVLNAAAPDSEESKHVGELKQKAKQQKKMHLSNGWRRQKKKTYSGSE